MANVTQVTNARSRFQSSHRWRTHLLPFSALVVLAVIAQTLVVGCTPVYDADHFFENGEFEKAIQEYDRAIEENPEYDLAYNNRGVSYASLGQPRRAIEDFNQAIRVEPLESLYYFNRGLAYADLGDTRSALEDLDRTIEMSPNGFHSPIHGRNAPHVTRGMVHETMGDDEQALRDYDRAIELDQDDPYAYFLRGTVRLGDYIEAVSDLDRSIAMNPTDPETFAARALAYTFLGNEEMSKQDALRAEEIGFDGETLDQRLKQAEISR